ncbi:MAG TPA: hypothetical protein VGB64_12175, partial [Actinomycetota bacterium]
GSPGSGGWSDSIPAIDLVVWTRAPNSDVGQEASAKMFTDSPGPHAEVARANAVMSHSARNRALVIRMMNCSTYRRCC